MTTSGSAWIDVLGILGLVFLGLAAWLGGGTVAIFAYIGVVCLALALAIAWRANQGVQ